MERVGRMGWGIISLLWMIRNDSLLVVILESIYVIMLKCCGGQCGSLSKRGALIQLSWSGCFHITLIWPSFITSWIHVKKSCRFPYSCKFCLTGTKYSFPCHIVELIKSISILRCISQSVLSTRCLWSPISTYRSRLRYPSRFTVPIFESPRSYRTARLGWVAWESSSSPPCATWRPLLCRSKGCMSNPRGWSWNSPLYLFIYQLPLLLSHWMSSLRVPIAIELCYSFEQ